MTDGEQAGAPTASGGARIDPVWRRGPNYEKAGYEYAVLMRQVRTLHFFFPIPPCPGCREARRREGESGRRVGGR
jgi:hypothetical protein